MPKITDNRQRANIIRVSQMRGLVAAAITVITETRTLGAEMPELALDPAYKAIAESYTDLVRVRELLSSLIGRLP